LSFSKLILKRHTTSEVVFPPNGVILKTSQQTL